MRRKTLTAREVEDLKIIVRRTMHGRKLTLPELRECERMLAINGQQYRQIIAEERAANG